MPRFVTERLQSGELFWSA